MQPLPRFAPSTLLCGLLVACGGGGQRPAPNPPSQPPVPATITQTVGAAGGTVAGPGDVTLLIPPDALAIDTQISITANPASFAVPPADTQTVGANYSLTPHRTTFGVPVTITIPFDPGAFAAGESPVLIKSTGDGGWQQLPVEVNGNTLRVAATSFSDVRLIRGVDTNTRMVVSIIDEPEDQTGFEGGFAIFRAEGTVRSSAVQVHYQWTRNGVRMPGETNASLLLPRLTLADDNSLYSVRASIGDGTFFADSRAARLLIVASAPVIVSQPLDEQVTAGQRVRFTAASTSSIAQTLQWSRCGAECVDLPNETAPVLTFDAGEADDGAEFRFCAANSGGATCSRRARLSVIPVPVQPTITRQPQPVTALAGTSAQFTVEARGGSLSFAWSHGRDGVNFVPHPTCADAATCTISNTTLADDGTYLRVAVSNVAGSATSAGALLTVRFNPGAASTRIRGGNAFSVGLAGNGTLRSWGANTSGQLGDGATLPRTDAVDVAGLADVATFAPGADHVVAVNTGGEVSTWGANSFGELGDGGSASRSAPAPVTLSAPARAVAAGVAFSPRSMVVLVDGSVWSWGANQSGQLGDGTILTRRSPVRAGNFTAGIDVAGGDGFTLALRDDGSLFGWGVNNAGQLGNGTNTASLVPIAIPMPERIVAMATGIGSALALTESGTVLAWGANVAGEVGDGTTERRNAPVPVALPAPVIAVAQGGNHSLALLLDGRVFAWGWNAYGQSGCDTADDRELVPCQVAAPLPADIVAIGAGANHSLALAADGTVWGWGHNFSGQLNDGTAMTESRVPVQVRNVNLN